MENMFNCTATGDFFLQNNQVVVLPSYSNRIVPFIFHVDFIAQETDETVRLHLGLSQSVINRFGGQFDNSVFFLETVELTIRDSDSKPVSCLRMLKN